MRLLGELGLFSAAGPPKLSPPSVRAPLRPRASSLPRLPSLPLELTLNVLTGPAAHSFPMPASPASPAVDAPWEGGSLCPSVPSPGPPRPNANLSHQRRRPSVIGVPFLPSYRPLATHRSLNSPSLLSLNFLVVWLVAARRWQQRPSCLRTLALSLVDLLLFFSSFFFRVARGLASRFRRPWPSLFLGPAPPCVRREDYSVPTHETYLRKSLANRPLVGTRHTPRANGKQNSTI